MADPVKTNNEKGLLERGGVAGALTGALLGGSREAAAGYDTVSTLRGKEQSQRHAENIEGRAQEEHIISKMTKYQDLQLKSLEINNKTLDLRVRQADQKRRMAVTDLATKRAVSLASKSGLYENLDEAELRGKLMDTVTDLPDKSAEFVLRASQSPQIKNRRGYEAIVKAADSAGIDLEQLGISKEWTPGSYAQWEAIGTMAQSERMRQANITAKETDHAMAVELAAVKEDFETGRKQMGIDSAEKIAVFNAKAAQQRAQTKAAASRGDVSIRDLGYENFDANSQMSVDYVTSTLPGWDAAQGDIKQGDDLHNATSWMTRTAQEILTVEARNFNAGITNTLPRTYNEVLTKLQSRLVSKITRDGEFHETETDELKEDRAGFVKNVKALIAAGKAPGHAAEIERLAISVGDDIDIETIINDYAKGLYGNPAARGFAAGTDKYTPPRETRTRRDVQSGN